MRDELNRVIFTRQGSNPQTSVLRIANWCCNVHYCYSVYNVFTYCLISTTPISIMSLASINWITQKTWNWGMGWRRWSEICKSLKRGSSLGELEKTKQEIIDVKSQSRQPLRKWSPTDEEVTQEGLEEEEEETDALVGKKVSSYHAPN